MTSGMVTNINKAATNNRTLNVALDGFIREHQLPAAYSLAVVQWFAPVAKAIARQQAALGKTTIVGISGAQGSGKSTLAELLALLCKNKYHLHAVVLSLDDFYLTRQQRKILAATVHPLLATRGVPGTHDIPLALDIIRKLCGGTSETLVPKFNKASDDRLPQPEWPHVTSKVDLILLEGWCLGAEPQANTALTKPVNELEKEADANEAWRHYINQQLHDMYPQLFGLIDYWIMLKAPSFSCVYQWRLEQENKLKQTLPHSDRMTGRSNRIMSADAVHRFIQHYQRITEHLLETLPARVDTLFNLDEDRKIISMQ